MNVMENGRSNEDERNGKMDVVTEINDKKSIYETENTSPSPSPTGLDLVIKKLKNFTQTNKLLISRALLIFLNSFVVGYFAWATAYFIQSKNRFESNPNEITNSTCGVEYCGIQWCDGYGMLIILLSLIYLVVLYHQIKSWWGIQIYQNFLHPLTEGISRIFARRILLIGLGAVILIAFAIFVAFDTRDSRHRLQSLIGIAVLLGIGLLFSKSPTQIKLRPVILGFTFQVLLGIFCIRWEVGRSIFICIGDKVTSFLLYSYSGSSFIYGNLLVNVEGVFAFAVLPVIFFFSFIISMLYYLGAMQWILEKMGWFIQSTLGTTVCESLICAANIFLGMSESSLLIRPYIKYLTYSEIHLIMASGFATVSGSVLVAYISYGADPAHLITSSVMAAPAAIAFSKLFYPETEDSQTKSGNMQFEKSTDSSLLDAASNGAGQAISMVMGIIANIVAFVAFIAFLNGVVSFLGMLIGYDFLTFEWIFAKLFIPLAWIIGVAWEDCENVAKVIATKTIINEFVAYERLGNLVAGEEISLRSSAIATYAICGFANPGSLGVLIGSLATQSPESRYKITSVAIRAFVSGSITCFITASIAGLLMSDDHFQDTRDGRMSTVQY